MQEIRLLLDYDPAVPALFADQAYVGSSRRAHHGLHLLQANIGGMQPFAYVACWRLFHMMAFPHRTHSAQHTRAIYCTITNRLQLLQIQAINLVSASGMVTRLPSAALTQTPPHSLHSIHFSMHQHLAIIANNYWYVFHSMCDSRAAWAETCVPASPTLAPSAAGQGFAFFIHKEPSCTCHSDPVPSP